MAMTNEQSQEVFVENLRPADYYRLPWNLNDNVLSWLEPTKRCNLKCHGCYSRNEAKWDKSLAQIRADLEVMRANRRFDSVSITGGDPLMHPDILEIVRIVRHDFGYKPVLNTNGLLLNTDLVRDLKSAGLFGLTLHIDSRQSRPGWHGKSERDLNALRLEYARMIHDVGGLSLAFNATIFADTQGEVPELLTWAEKHIDMVHSMVFILFRTTRTSAFEYLARGKRVNPAELVYHDDDDNPDPLTAADLVRTIRVRDPAFTPSAYLGGTKNPQSFKWLIAARFGDGEQILGYAGKRFMEAAQVGHHFFTGRYLAYSSPAALKSGRAMMLAGALVDSGARAAAMHYARGALRALRLPRTLHFQTVAIIQPIDMLADGEMNMCDGCPDMTVHNGELVWSCRLDERLRYGCFLTAAPKEDPARTPS